MIRQYERNGEVVERNYPLGKKPPFRVRHEGQWFDLVPLTGRYRVIDGEVRRVDQRAGVAPTGDVWKGKDIGKPITMYSEFRKGEGPTCDIPGTFDSRGFRVMTSIGDVHEYQARAADAGYPSTWAHDQVNDTRPRDTYRPEK